MANNYYMQKQAAWQTAAEDALTKQAAGLADIQRQAVDFMQKNPELVGSLLGGTAGAGLGALTAPEDENGEVSTAKRLLYALGGGALGAGAGAAAPSAKAWLDKWLAERKGSQLKKREGTAPGKRLASREVITTDVGGIPVQDAHLNDDGDGQPDTSVADMAGEDPLAGATKLPLFNKPKYMLNALKQYRQSKK